MRPADGSLHPAPKRWPYVAVVIPARNEAPSIARAVQSLLVQNYPGRMHLFVVDDHSADGTAEQAVAAALNARAEDRLTVIRAAELPEGWTGKLWALAQGLQQALPEEPGFLLFTDADILHDRQNVRQLVARAECERLELASLMVRLHCRNLAERFLIPAFVYFFFKLYPPEWISHPHRSTAGAAGGCLLVRPAALARIGGIESIRGEVIDDCALARRVKACGGRIWLGLSVRTASIRPYRSALDVGRMISRTAYTQLRHSPFLLAGTLAAMALTYFVPPAVVFSGNGAAAGAGLAAFGLMAASYLPVLRCYDRSPVWAPLLPLAALFYTGATVASAVRYYQGRGGEWKGRAQAPRS